MCKLLLTEDKMDIYELNDDQEKFKNFVCSFFPNEDIFSPNELSKNLTLMQRFEKNFPAVYTDEKAGEQGKKALVYTGLLKIKEVYERKKNDIVHATGESKLQAVLVESSILSINSFNF